VSSVDYLREVADLRPGTHLLCLYATEREHRGWVTPFLLEGLQRGERVVYLRDQREAETILGYLWEAGVDPAPYLASDQLALPQARTLLDRDGQFVPQAAVEELSEEIARAIERGFTGLRMTAEMSWSVRLGDCQHKLLEYECKSNGLFAEELFIGMCQYDRREFSAEQLLEAIAVHPEVLSDQGRHRNVFFSTPRHLGEECAAAALLAHRLETLTARSRALRRLETELEAVTAVLDAVEARVAVLDRQGLPIFLNRAWEETWGESTARMRRQPLWEGAATLDQQAALRALLDLESPVAFPRFYQGPMTFGGRPSRPMTCTARLLVAAGRQRVVLTLSEP
jgi:PAS domain-containing protein